MFASALKRCPVWAQLRTLGMIWHALTGSAARQYAADCCQPPAEREALCAK